MTKEQNNNILTIEKIEKLNSFAESMSANDASAAYKSAEEALLLSQEVQYSKGEIHSLFYLGESLYRQGRIYDAINMLRESLKLSDINKDTYAQSMIFTTLGNAHLYLKLYDLSFYYYRMALSACEENNRFESQAMIFNNIGEIYRELGDYEQALEAYSRCLDISDKNNFARVGMYATANIGIVDYETKNYQAAIYYLEKSKCIAREINNQIIEGFSLRHLGLIHSEVSEYDKAKSFFEEAMSVYKKTNETISQARLYKDFADMEYKQRNFLGALNYLNRAKDLTDGLQDQILMINIYQLFSKIYEALNDFKAAFEYNNRSLKSREEKESQEKEHRLKSIDFQVKTWDEIKESKNYQEINKQLREKTETLERVTKELQKINQEVKVLSNMDGLTRIANRIKLDSFAQDLFAKAYKNKSKVTMMIIDIDNFKEYNDFYGHLIGDEALIKLAEILEKSIENKEGLVARFGGDEFVIVINDCDLEEARNISKFIAKSLKEKKIKHEKSIVNHYLTVSVGIIAKVPQKKTTYALFMDFADQALYQAKAKGKNQTEVYENLN
ncbi:MAG: tetratricopeptide repeat-containing diguanylate cyclase [Candidatus Izemoplasmatales bacterium]|nr:tetratricopeptide repeat-containing diguanylate cyclase [Candidatus Izemoplasmatales bacterium]